MPACPLPSPRLPTELLGLIIDYLEDSHTMRACSLAGSCLHPYAQRALFRDVKIFVGKGGSGNLAKMLECYSKRPYAMHARSLNISSGTQDVVSLQRYSDLRRIITLLSTCPQSVNSAIAHCTPVSSISSLTFTRMTGPAVAFARVICAFPSLTRLDCTPGSIWATPGKKSELDRFLAIAPSAPHLQHLKVRDGWFRDMIPVLFPPEAVVELRSLTILDCSDTASWAPVVQRAGHRLEELCVSAADDGGEADGSAVVDLSANTRLRSITLESPRFKENEFLQCAIPTLCSITSDRLEHVTLGACFIMHRDVVRVACNTLEQALTEGPRSKTLRRLELLRWRCFVIGEVYAGLRRVTLTTPSKEYLQQAFPKCQALGFLYESHQGAPL